ncbi:MAG: hypothetical protein AAFQ80_07890 [Cyanobacteria bacterium J06621_8]
MKTPELISINPSLNRKAKFFWIIPSSQIVPLGVIAFFCFLIVGSLGGKEKHLGMTFGFFGLTWLAATGSQPHLLLDRVRPLPGKEWRYTRLPYFSPVPERRAPEVKGLIKDQELTAKPPPFVEMSQNGKKEVFPSFSRYQNLVSPIQFNLEGKDLGGMWLSQNQEHQIVFLFRVYPWHTSTLQEQPESYIESIETAIKEILLGESVTFYCEKYTSDVNRIAQLEKSIANCDHDDISLLVQSDMGRTQSLSRQGLKQNFSFVISCTFSFSRDEGGTDIVSRIIRNCNKILSGITGDTHQLQQEFITSSLEQAYVQGFNIWQSILKTVWKLDVTPLSLDQSWEYLWYQFNPRHTKPEAIPNYWTWDGREFAEIVNNSVHPLSVLTRGVGHLYSCPQHNQRHDQVYLPGRNQVCGLLTIEDISKRKLTKEQQLRYLFDILRREDITDTEFVIQLNPVKAEVLDRHLEQTIAQVNSAKLTAEDGAVGRDVASEQMLEASFEAQKLIGGGGAGVYLSFVAKVYRQDPKTLNQACAELSRHFNGDLKRQENAVWALWLETLPISVGRILQNTSLFGFQDRRIKLDNISLPRYLPNIALADVHDEGIELIAEGGKPIYLDTHRLETKRVLVIGESGSGKTILLWQIMLDFRLHNIPVIGIDSAVGSTSSFDFPMRMVKGSHVDISRHSTNLVEPPDLRIYKGDDYLVRFNQWRSTVTMTLVNYIMFGIKDNPQLSQRVEVLVSATTDKFTSDAKIVRRINKAFEAGFGSDEWSKIPTLVDWLKFCTKEKLKLKDFEELDKIAINQIQSQVQALLHSSLGQTVGSPSSFNPDCKFKFFTITNLESERDQALVTQTIQSTCIRLALRHPKSLIVGDEIADLLKKSGFAQVWGAMHNMSRKSGVSMLTTTTNIDAILNCSASSDILNNLSFKLTGRITTDAAESLVRTLKYPALIYENSTQAYATDKERGCSHWLLEIQNQFWQTRFFPSHLNLALVANGSDEVKLRNEIMQKALANGESKWTALCQFAKENQNRTSSKPSILN